MHSIKPTEWNIQCRDRINSHATANQPYHVAEMYCDYLPAHITQFEESIEYHALYLQPATLVNLSSVQTLDTEFRAVINSFVCVFIVSPSDCSMYSIYALYFLFAPTNIRRLCDKQP